MGSPTAPALGTSVRSKAQQGAESKERPRASDSDAPMEAHDVGSKECS